MRFRINNGNRSEVSRWRYLVPGAPYRLEVATDIAWHTVTVNGPVEGDPLLVEDRHVPLSGPVVGEPTPVEAGSAGTGLTVVERAAPVTKLCQSLRRAT